MLSSPRNPRPVPRWKDYSQTPLLARINEYLYLQNRPLISEVGHCHGLDLNWLYKMDHGEEDSFYASKDRIIDCSFTELLAFKGAANGLLRMLKKRGGQEVRLYAALRTLVDKQHAHLLEIATGLGQIFTEEKLTPPTHPELAQLRASIQEKNEEALRHAQLQISLFIGGVTESQPLPIKAELAKIALAPHTRFIDLKMALDRAYNQQSIPETLKPLVYKLNQNIHDYQLGLIHEIKHKLNLITLKMTCKGCEPLKAYAALARILNQPYEKFSTITAELGRYLPKMKMNSKEGRWAFDLLLKAKKKLPDPLLAIQRDMEKWLAKIEWPQNSVNYMPKLTQTQIHEFLETQDTKEKKGDYTLEEVAQLVREIAEKNKMVCVIGDTPLRHSIAIYKKGDIYSVYNPSSPYGKARRFITALAVAKELKRGFYDFFDLDIADNNNKLSLEFYATHSTMAVRPPDPEVKIDLIEELRSLDLRQSCDLFSPRPLQPRRHPLGLPPLEVKAPPPTHKLPQPQSQPQLTSWFGTFNYALTPVAKPLPQWGGMTRSRSSVFFEHKEKEELRKNSITPPVSSTKLPPIKRQRHPSVQK